MPVSIITNKLLLAHLHDNIADKVLWHQDLIFWGNILI